MAVRKHNREEWGMPGVSLTSQNVVSFWIHLGLMYDSLFFVLSPFWIHVHSLFYSLWIRLGCFVDSMLHSCWIHY